VDADEYARFERRQKERLATHARRSRPPDNEVPGVLAIGSMLGRRTNVVVVLVEVHVYSLGLEFVTTARSHPDYSVSFLPDVPEIAQRLGRRAASLPDVSVVYRGGARVEAIGSRALFDLDQPSDETPTLCASGGGGNDRKLGRWYWLTPRPYEDIELNFGWAEHGMPETRTPIAATEIAAALTLSQELWPWSPPV
jgi:hypothetical protein